MGDNESRKTHQGQLLFYNDGEVIFRENSAGKEIYIIESGEVEISQLIDRMKVPLAILKKGTFFGEMAPISGTLRTTTAVAIGKVALIALSMEEMIERMKKDNLFMVSAFQRLVSQVRSANTRLRSLTFKMHELDRNSDEQEDKEVPSEAYESLRRTNDYLHKRVDQKDKQIESLRQQLRQLQSQNKEKSSFWRKSR